MGRVPSKMVAYYVAGYVFQSITLLYCQWVLSFEVKCKVNSLETYTSAFFSIYGVIYLASAIYCSIIYFSKNVSNLGVMKNIFLTLLLVLYSRFIVSTFLTIYHFFNKEAFHTFSTQEDLLKVSKSKERQGTGIIHLHMKSPSLMLHSRESPGTIRLKVLDRVNVCDAPRGVINYYKIEVLCNGNKLATVEKTYKDFKIFQTNMVNFFRGSEHLDLPLLEPRSTVMHGLLPSSGETYR